MTELGIFEQIRIFKHAKACQLLLSVFVVLVYAISAISETISLPRSYIIIEIVAVLIGLIGFLTFIGIKIIPATRALQLCDKQTLFRLPEIKSFNKKVIFVNSVTLSLYFGFLLCGGHHIFLKSKIVEFGAISLALFALLFGYQYLSSISFKMVDDDEFILQRTREGFTNSFQIALLLLVLFAASITLGFTNGFYANIPQESQLAFGASASIIIVVVSALFGHAASWFKYR